MSGVEIIDDVMPSNDEEQFFKGLTWTQRIQGYLLFLALGMFATIMSWIALGLGYYWKYTVLSTLGCLMSMCSTVILMGPAAQLQYMFDEYRRVATVLYIGSLFLSIFVAFALKSVFLCMLCGLLQYITLAWYSLSYIPYGRETVWMFLFRRLEVEEHWYKKKD